VSPFLTAVAALVPSIGVGFLFYLAIRALVNADRDRIAGLGRAAGPSTPDRPERT